MAEGTFIKTGLTPEEAQKKLQEFGLNEFEKQKDSSSLKILFSQFKSPLVYILVLAGIATLLLREFTDSIVIFAAVFLNTTLGFYQEFKAQKALAALRNFLTPKAKVVRDGEAFEIQASQLVPGDLVILAIGSRVPADGILVEATDLSVNEAVLTGESMPVKKLETLSGKLETEGREKENQVFMGTIVVTGIAKMVVTKTGMATEMGKIGKSLVEIEEEKTPLQLQMAKLAKILAIVFGIATFLIFTLGSLLGYELREMFTISVAVAVAAIPEGLVVTLTVILALGMQRILKRKALVRRLIAAETLGSVSVICLDKTGTLTEGQLKVVKAELTDEKRGQQAAVLCNDLRDPLEIAMLSWAQGKASEKGFTNEEEILEAYPRLDGIPFSPQRKYMATLHPGILFISGAPEVILSASKLTSDQAKIWQEKFDGLGRKGYRLVGLAYKEVEKGKEKIKKEDLASFSWLGILAYEDPVREGVREALEECQKAGIKVKVVTGDYVATAVAVLEKLGFKLDSQTQVMEGVQVDALSPEEFGKKISKVVLFARTNPEQKLKIVKALKEEGEVVAMTGDGVNDAPALKMADIGIVVGEASDVARETADIVLLDSQFSTIVHAIEEGRTIFENIKKVVLYLLSGTFTEIVLIGGSLLLRLPLPVLATQILWVNLIEDGLPAIALAFEPEEKEVMQQPPRPRNAPLLDLEMKTLIFFICLLTDVVLLALFYFLLKGFLHLSFLQTVMFVALGIDSLLYVFVCRSFRKTVFQKNPLENKFLVFSVITGFSLLVGAVYLSPFQVLLKTHALGGKEWFFLFSLGVSKLFAIEVTKWFFIAKRKPS